MKMSEQTSELFTALSEAQGEIENVSKDKSGYGYKYADLGSCIDAIKPSMKKNGLAIVQVIDNEEGVDYLVTMLTHKSGEWMEGRYRLEAAGIKGANTAQQMGAAITYARRYCLASMIGLAQEDDDAANVKSAPKPEFVSKDDLTFLRKDLKAVGLVEEEFCIHAKIDALESLPKERFRGAMTYIKNYAEDIPQ